MILEHARLHGIDTLDTAISYGDSEQRLGEIGIQAWHVISKLPTVSEVSRDISQLVADIFSKSLERLKVKRLEGLLFHQPQQLLGEGGNRLYRAAQQLKRNGLVRKIGVSVYEPAELDFLCSRYQFDIVQVPFNIMDCRFMELGWWSRLREQGIELHVRSVFLQGLLLMPAHDRPEKFNRWAPLWLNFENWLKLSELTPLQACLRYVLSFPEIKKVIIGIDSLSQLKAILRAATGPIPQVPKELQLRNIDLLNPTCWTAL